MSTIAITIRRSTRVIAVAALALTTGSCISGAGSANSADSSKTNQHHWYQIGRASWYGKYFQGRQTASGENYDMNLMTCAHRSLPLGTLLKVTNLLNHRSVVVRVNDRGPVPESRVIDLSRAAADFIGMGSRGLAPVRLDVMDGTTVSQMQWPAVGPMFPELPLR